MSTFWGRGNDDHPPPLPRPPTTRIVALTMSPQPAGRARLTTDGGAVYEAVRYRDTGRMEFTIPVTTTGGADLELFAEGYETYFEHVALDPDLLKAPVDLVLARPALLPVRVEAGRYRTDAGWLVPLFATQFLAIWWVLTGRIDVLRWQLDRATTARRNGIRIAGMLDWAQYKFSPRSPGYWEAFAVVIAECLARGLYVECAFFCDAQRIVPDKAERERWVQLFATFCNAHPSLWAQMANEPRKNGWGDADDPALLALGRLCKTIAPRTILSIGDPHDTPGYGLKQRTIATVADYLVLHASRAGNSDKDQFRRWVDHLKGFADGRPSWPDKALLHDEPMGGASVFQSGRRDNSVVAHVAGAVIGCMIGGYTYLHRPEEDDTAPGLIESGIAADIPGSPDYRFINATIQGSPVAGFKVWDKIRTMSNGRQGWACAFGTRIGTVDWASGWTQTLVYALTDADGSVAVWKTQR